MSNTDQSASMDRMHTLYDGQLYVFWLISSRPLAYDAYQSVLSVHCNSHRLEYRPSKDDEIFNDILKELHIEPRYGSKPFTCPTDAMFDFSTPESIIQSLHLFHFDFLTEHGIRIEHVIKPVGALQLPEGLDV